MKDHNIYAMPIKKMMITTLGKPIHCRRHKRTKMNLIPIEGRDGVFIAKCPRCNSEQVRMDCKDVVYQGALI